MVAVDRILNTPLGLLGAEIAAAEAFFRDVAVGGAVWGDWTSSPEFAAIALRMIRGERRVEAPYR